MSEIKSSYPDQWVLVGNPEMDKQELHVLSGLVALHSKDKKEVCYLGAELVKRFDTYMILYTGEPRPARRLTGIFSRIKK
jgi:hypothetical protein